MTGPDVPVYVIVHHRPPETIENTRPDREEAFMSEFVMGRLEYRVSLFGRKYQLWQTMLIPSYDTVVLHIESGRLTDEASDFFDRRDLPGASCLVGTF